MESFILSLVDSLSEHLTAVSHNPANCEGVIPLMTADGVTTVGVKALLGVRESLLAMLKRITTYFRTDFSVHAQLDSSCATLCVRYALSSHGDPRFQSPCSHEHTMSCSDCNLAVHFVKELQHLLTSVVNLHILSEREVERLTFVLEECESHLAKYIGHRVRTIHQNSVPGREMADMGYTEAYIIMDYMNEWLPFKHRATTSDAFGQAGESVHGATVYVRVLPEQGKEVISNGSNDDHKQDQWHAASVTEATLSILKEVEPQVEAARLRFDNATCYHGTLYWLLVSIMEKATGIKITEVGMNEAGEGKDETDRSFTTAKAYVRRLVHLGSLDAKMAADFVGTRAKGWWA
ncbi:hypothetical protein CYMTET_30762 [Cymbomonas tetramitiformis]|uniref:Uncharacterized protein n=1 Tax=Cymbomonas tetramitiformis TaxID=36881 RepID=A0AAE0FI66_9CHLO|nr:hypothetical protein CYMTET_30762 [Cymbomonas tetramitiformis]